MIEILVIFLVGALGFYLGQRHIKHQVKEFDYEYKRPSNKNLPKTYDSFMEGIENLLPVDIACICDIAHSYGYREGYNDGERNYEEDLMDMFTESMEAEHFSGNIELSSRTPTNKDEILN